MSGLNYVAKLIRDRCNEEGWSIDDVVERSGLPRSTVWSWVRKREIAQTLAREQREALARGLGVLPAEVDAALARSLDLPVNVEATRLDAAQPGARVVVRLLPELGDVDVDELARRARYLHKEAQRRKIEEK